MVPLSQPLVSLASVSDDELLGRLTAILKTSRRVEAVLVAHIGEVDTRRLYAREGSTSMFAYCTDVLHLSEPEAYLRIAVARAAREHPLILMLLAAGRPAPERRRQAGAALDRRKLPVVAGERMRSLEAPDRGTARGARAAAGRADHRAATAGAVGTHLRRRRGVGPAGNRSAGCCPATACRCNSERTVSDRATAVSNHAARSRPLSDPVHCGCIVLPQARPPQGPPVHVRAQRRYRRADRSRGHRARRSAGGTAIRYDVEAARGRRGARGRSFALLADGCTAGRLRA